MGASMIFDVTVVLQGTTIGLVAWVLQKVHTINGSVKEIHQWRKDHETLHRYLDKT